MKERMGWQSVVDALEVSRSERPLAVALTWLSRAGKVETVLSYEQLSQRVRATAGRIQSVARPKSRVLVLVPPGPEFVVALWGTLFSGCIAVPGISPDAATLRRGIARLRAVVSDSQCELVLTTASVVAQADLAGLSELLASMRVLLVDDLESAGETDWQRPELRGEDLSIIQYTSGSTGSPKGVVLTHANLAANCAGITAALGLTPEQALVSWLPPYHDMGLIGGILQPLWLGMETIQMSPMAFIQRPLRWLEAISRSGAKVSGGPDFAYRLAVEKSTEEERALLDLSGWSCAFTGAEPVRSSTLDLFANAFACSGFQRSAFLPCYGLAEVTLMATGAKRGTGARRIGFDAKQLQEGQTVIAAPGADARFVVSCGVPLEAHKLRIIDPKTSLESAAGSVGEIWISGPSVAQGYWQADNAAENTFFRDASSPFAWLRTGDLGTIQDGELFITGRLKDVIIIRGRNHYPHDIEDTVRLGLDALGVSMVAAYAKNDTESEVLCIVVEQPRAVRRDRATNHEDDLLASITPRIRALVGEVHGLDVGEVVLVPAGAIPRTSSGKTQRALCRDQIANGAQTPLGVWTSEASTPEPSKPKPAQDTGAWGSIEELLVAWLAEKTNVPQLSIDVHAPLSQYGLDSAQSVSLAARLEQHLGRAVSPTLFWDYPTVAKLAEHLQGGDSETGRTAVSASSDEEIAIVGVGCLLPGARGRHDFWANLRGSECSIGEIPSGRWSLDDLYHSDPSHAGTMNTKWGGFCADVDYFDADLFSISAREARHIDPQHRILLEVAWEALEDYGVAPQRLAGSQTGVYVGISTNDYSILALSDAQALSAYTGVGNAHSIAANRISYFFDFRGPSISVDTACSSSLVAVHQACEALRRGEVSLALAGGVNLMLTPHLTIGFSRAHMMAADGRCKTFDESADGYVRGEGCGVVVLKRLSDALRDGDRILATVAGSAVNQDGRTNGLTAPNGVSQEEVIRAALARAAVLPVNVSYVEAHGTGTPLGDPIEFDALRRVYGAGRTEEKPLRIGSVKTNIGHLEAAAGVAGLIKVALALSNREIPAHLHLKKVNSRIKLDAHIQIPTCLTPWHGQERHAAGLSAFGFGGTNVHMILRGAPEKTSDGELSTPQGGAARSKHVLALSAASETSLRHIAEAYVRRLEQLDNSEWPAFCYSANTGRAQLPCRMAVATDSPVEAAVAIRRILAGASGQFQPAHAPKVAFMFTGQGSQYLGMGRELFESSTSFRSDVEACSELFLPYLHRRLTEVIYEQADAKLLDSTEWAQAALFSFEYALGRLWMSWGVTPTVVLGHSIGEIVAAQLAGSISLRDAVAIVAARGQCMTALPRNGAMLAVSATAEDVAVHIGDRRDVVIAAYNAPNRIVISGAEPSIEAVGSSLLRAGIGVQPLSVSHAFHSPLMQSIAEPFRAALDQVNFSTPKVPLISNVTGECVTEPFTSSYWLEHALGPVRFQQGIQTARAMGCDVLLEIGPRPTLSSLARATFNGDCLVLASLADPRSDVKDWASISEAVAKVFQAGVAVNWDRFGIGAQCSRVAVPGYVFDRRRFWLTDVGPVERSVAPALSASALHPLIDSGVTDGKKGVYRKQFVQDLVVRQHVVRQVPILPGVGFLEMGLAATRAFSGSAAATLNGVVIVNPLALESELEVDVLIEAEGEGSGAWRFEVRTGERVHAKGRTSAEKAHRTPPIDVVGLRQVCRKQLSKTQIYAAFAAVGIEYGPYFQSIVTASTDGEQAFAELSLSPIAIADGPYLMHPALLDASLQVLGLLIAESDPSHGLYVPFSFREIKVINRLPSRLCVWARRRPGKSASREVLIGDVTLLDLQGNALVTISEVCLKLVRATAPLIGSNAESLVPQGLQAEPVLANVALAMAPEVTRLGELHALQRFADLGSQLDEVCAMFALAALRDFGVDMCVGTAVSVREVCERLTLPLGPSRLVRRLLEIAHEDGYLAQWDGEQGTWAVTPTTVQPFERVDRLLQAYPACDAEIQMLRRCGGALASVVRGEVPALSLLFPAGSAELVAGVYETSPFSQYYNTILQTLVGQLFSTAEPSSLRMLEIGAGTGGTTSYVLPQLHTRINEYVFTDLSPMFLARAKHKFSAHSCLRTAILDVEKDIEQQGQALHSYDCVIAANVLHATVNLAAAARAALRLVRPGGYVVLLEGTRKQRILDLTFGLTDGWWRFTDTDARPDYPLVSEEQWKQVLVAEGAAEVNWFPGEGATTSQAVIVARAPGTPRVYKAAQPSYQDIHSRARAQEAGTTELPLRHQSGGTLAMLRDTLATCLKCLPEEVQVQRNFADMGLDSLLAMEFVDKLQKELGVTLQPTLLFECPNCVALAEHLESEHRLPGVSTSAAESRDVTPQLPDAVSASPSRYEGNGRRTAVLKTERLTESTAAIAVIGMACRFPRASNVEEFWQMLMGGVDAVTEIPANRWDVKSAKASRFGAFLDTLDMFDPLFFEIAPKEAKLIDPQQRLFMEVAWEALEHAGYGGLMDSDTGVFVGASNADYFDRIKARLTADDYAAGLGNKNCIIPNRFSYFMNFRGPSLTVDTACSSSLVALHMACESLRRGECSVAIAGGVNALLSPTYYGALHRMGVQAPDGRCKAFDDSANGFASGEGAGAVILKPLADAERDGDNVWAVIRGSAVNHDGRSNGLSAPNPAAHAQVIEQAYRNANVSPASLTYVEAHGTGTALGDPIEVDGLTRAFRAFTDQSGYCRIGSVKTHIAHLEPAAGIASVIKVILSLQHRIISPHLHYRKPNRRIPFEQTPFFVASEASSWDAPVRRAGVSSFGMGGANAHVVIEEGRPASLHGSCDAEYWMLPLSAKTDAALRALVAVYDAMMEKSPDLNIRDMCATAALGRTHFAKRVAVVGRSTAEIAASIRALAKAKTWEGLTVPGVWVGSTNNGSGIESSSSVHALAHAYANGQFVDFSKIEALALANKVVLPSYPFQRQSHWVPLDHLISTSSVKSGVTATSRKQHPFLSARVR